jgi:hypothetical protein
MQRIAILAGSSALGLSAQAFGYSASGTLTFSWRGNGGGIADATSQCGAT